MNKETSFNMQHQRASVNPPAPAPLVGVLLGPESTKTSCPFCHASSVNTAVEYSTTSRTHAMAAFYFIFCCCCIPYCCNSARNTDHYCPNCKRYIGTYEK